MSNRCYDPECVLCKGRYPEYHWIWQTLAAIALVTILAWASQW